MAETIDRKLLPRAPLFDTSALIAASGGPTRKGEEGACVLLFDALLAAKSTILIAAPSFAEFLHGKPKRRIPHLAGIDVVPFDRGASEILAERFPKDALTRFRDQASKGMPPLDYIKYDVMIVACAVRHKADVFVTLDDDQRKMAVSVGLTVRWPREFLSPQQNLDLKIT